MIKNWNKMLTCPACGFESVHPIEVCVICGATQYVIDSTGMRKEFNLTPDGARGVIIIRTYQGECGHNWREIEQFHKGSTYTETEIAPDGFIFDSNRLNTIWRD